MIVAKSTPVVMIEVTDPAEKARFYAQRERFDKNLDWLLGNRLTKVPR